MPLASFMQDLKNILFLTELSLYGTAYLITWQKFIIPKAAKENWKDLGAPKIFVEIGD